MFWGTAFLKNKVEVLRITHSPLRVPSLDSAFRTMGFLIEEGLGCLISRGSVFLYKV